MSTNSISCLHEIVKLGIDLLHDKHTDLLEIHKVNLLLLELHHIFFK